MTKPHTHRYDDIINLPHHQSKVHPHMSLQDRAAQFAPFAALTGHSAAINETARLTNRKIDLSDSECDLLNMKTSILMEHIHEHPEVSIAFFVNDECKEGGHYITHSGIVKSCDDYEQTIFFEDGTRIRTSEIIDIRGKLFENLTY